MLKSGERSHFLLHENIKNRNLFCKFEEEPNVYKIKCYRSKLLENTMANLVNSCLLFVC